MKLRHRIVLGFLLLAVLPLAAIVGYSYLSSVQAMRDAVAAESRQLAEQIELSLKRARGDLERGMAQVDRAWQPGAASDPRQFERVLEAVGESMAPIAHVLQGFQFEALPAPADAPGAPAARPASPPPALDGEGGELAGEIAEAERAREEAERIAERWQRAGEQFARLMEERARVWAEQHGSRIERQVERALEREVRQEARQRERRASRDQNDSAPTVWQPSDAEQALGMSLRSEIEGVGELRAEIDLQRFLGSVLATTGREQGEIPFVFGADAELYTVSPEDRDELLDLTGGSEELLRRTCSETGTVELDDWLVAARVDEESGLVFGIARPLDESLEQIRRASGRNLMLGMAILGISLIGIVPFSNRMTGSLESLTVEAERLARGDLDARAPVTRQDELGHLAVTFNRMAGELESQRRQLLENERSIREREVERARLEIENRRRGEELEEARAFQLSLLPSELPRRDDLEVAVSMKTATEVGGDYYDFAACPEGLTIALGDAAGHGARAGTLVTVLKTLFAHRDPEEDLCCFLERGAETVRGMRLGRNTMAFSLVTIEGGRLAVASAAMPPVLILRTSGVVDEIASEGLPLGALHEARYTLERARVDVGDTVLLMSDGFAEQLDDRGDPVGYEHLREVIATLEDPSPAELLSRLEAEVRRLTGGRPPTDDVTFVAVRRTA